MTRAQQLMMLGLDGQIATFNDMASYQRYMSGLK